MLTSAALCTYNGAAWLREQLDSIAGQSRRPDELVICDDGSTDATPNILSEFAAKAPFPVFVHINEKNLGSTQNFARAIGLCKGDVIFLADQDDIWLPTKIENLARLFEDSPSVGMAFGDGEVVDAEARPMGYTLWQATRFSPVEQKKMMGGRAEEVLLRHSVAHGATAAFRASLRSLILPIPAIPGCGHDYWAALIVSGVADFALLPEPVLKYRLHGENVVGIRRRTLREQIALGKELSAPRVFRDDAAIVAAAIERLSTAAAVSESTARPAVLAKMREKLQHLQRRERMSFGLLGRLAAIVRETFNGRYLKYSQGWRSVAQDLFLRRTPGPAGRGQASRQSPR